MGSTQAYGWASMVAEGAIGLTLALESHLQFNHYPPVPTSIVPQCIEAIEHAAQEDWDHTITAPSGRELSVSEWIDELHLGPFVEAFQLEPGDADSFDPTGDE